MEISLIEIFKNLKIFKTSTQTWNQKITRFFKLELGIALKFFKAAKTCQKHLWNIHRWPGKSSIPMLPHAAAYSTLFP